MNFSKIRQKFPSFLNRIIDDRCGDINDFIKRHVALITKNPAA